MSVGGFDGSMAENLPDRIRPQEAEIVSDGQPFDDQSPRRRSGVVIVNIPSLAVIAAIAFAAAREIFPVKMPFPVSCLLYLICIAALMRICWIWGTRLRLPTKYKIVAVFSPFILLGVSWSSIVEEYRDAYPKKPFFKVSLIVSDGTISTLELTNDFLMLPGAGSNLLTGGLFIPKKATNSEIWLHFQVYNASDVVADLPIELSVWLPKRLAPAPADEWTPLTSTSFFPASPLLQEELEAFMHEIPTALLRHRKRFSPGIKIHAPSTVIGPIMIRVTSRNSDPLHLAFQSVVIHGWKPWLTKPYIFKMGSRDDPFAGTPAL
jgi:hypothetical protein